MAECQAGMTATALTDPKSTLVDPDQGEAYAAELSFKVFVGSRSIFGHAIDDER
jgi:hypothetical protein